MSDPNYQAGKSAFDRGEYRQAVQFLELALAAVNPNSNLGGEVQIWLLTALEAVGRRSDALEICHKLAHHPHLDTRQTSKRMLYIMQAPELSRKAEWLSEIPDLSDLDDSQTIVTPKSNSNSASLKKERSPAEEYQALDRDRVDTKDNGFVWIALLITVLTLLGLWWA